MLQELLERLTPQQRDIPPQTPSREGEQPSPTAKAQRGRSKSRVGRSSSKKVTANSKTPPYTGAAPSQQKKRDFIKNGKCKHCATKGTLDHIILEGDSSPGAQWNINCREAWEALLRSEDPASQQQAISLAEGAAKSQDLFACLIASP
ncbi:hypothetical protein HPB52_006842 [Rhipicephalus sanguineus]|uniref:Uncharacterized protein n=1 Tax=Rhipicephalus sanguineus TaxID=34632 RepID=A0A9D4SQE1_RHISA|nr:hypothetical protein HPB52_006842 [Rhipicephalus sanguineus]